MIKLPTWSVWFPYPSSWARAGILSIIFSAVVFVVVRFGHAGVKSVILLKTLGPLFLLIWIGTVLPFVGYAYLHSLFLGKSKPKTWPKSLPCPNSIWEAFYSFNVMSLSAQIVIVIAMCFMGGYDDIPSNAQMEALATLFGLVWFISSAYFFQLEYVLRQYLRPTALAKPLSSNLPRPVKAPTPIDWEEAELNQLRSEMGLSPMKQAKE